MLRPQWIRWAGLSIGVSLILAGCVPDYTASPPLMMREMMNGGYTGGMMGGGHMNMMNGGSVTVPTIAPTPFGATPIPVDEEITLIAKNLQFSPAQVTIKAGELVRWRITNQDAVPHNFYSEPAAIPYLPLPGNATQDLVWQAPSTTGTDIALCTFHPGMIIEIVVVEH